MRRGALAIALVIGISISLRAQPSDVRVGERVRLVAPDVVSGSYVGSILGVSADTLRVGSPSSGPLVVPRDRIVSIEVSGGRSRWLGARTGALWGIPTGIVLGILTYPSSHATNRADYVGFITYASVIGGAEIGALIGRERWTRR